MPTNPRDAADDDSDVEFEIELNPNNDTAGDTSTAHERKQGKTAVQPEEVLAPQQKTVRPAVDPAVRQRYKARIFALRNNRLKKSAVNLAAAANRTYNYEEIYDVDEYGKEAFPEARVWKVYNDETAIFDLEKIEAWRDALDVLLVFIGLFSAIVTTFVVQTSLALKPDYAQLTFIVTLEVLRTMTNSTTSNPSLQFNGSDSRFGEATPSSNDIAVNALWFTSLAVSLSTALLAVLTKQWLYHYTTSTSGTSRERARIRQFRYAGLERYHVPLIIDILPILLHISLAMFLAGLAVFLKPLHGVMFGIVVAVAGLAYMLYFASIVAPLVDYQCPYKSPLSFYVYQLHRLGMNVWLRSRSALLQAWKARQQQPAVVAQSDLRQGPQTTPLTHHALPSLGEAEKSSVLRQGLQLDLDAIIWLYQTSANNTVRNISFEALGGLAPCTTLDTTAACHFIDENIHAVVGQWTQKGLSGNMVPRPGEEYRYDRLARALCVGLRVEVPAALGLHPHESNVLALHNHFSVFVLDNDSFSYPLDFITSGSGRDVVFPLPVWALVLRLVKSRQRQNLSVMVGILSSLHLPINGSEMGVVNLETALQHPEVRLLGAEYLGVKQLISTNILSLIHSTLSPLLANGRRGYPYPLSPLFKSLASYPADFYHDKQHIDAIQAILATSFESVAVDRVSWETFNYITDTWEKIQQTTVDNVTTPLTIRRMFGQLRSEEAPRAEEIPWVKQAMRNLGYIFGGALDPKFPRLAKAVCDAIISHNILPARGDVESLRPFWTQSMCSVIVTGTCKLQKQGYEWFSPWMEYVHTHERLFFLAKLLLTEQTWWGENSHVDLCGLQPTHPNWPACITSLIDLLQNQAYLDSLTSYNDSPVRAPRQALSRQLIRMKRILQAHHDLTGSAFDIPMFDDHDNQIDLNSEEMVPPRLATDFPSIGTPVNDQDSPHSQPQVVDSQVASLDITSTNDLRPPETGQDAPDTDVTGNTSAEDQHLVGSRVEEISAPSEDDDTSIHLPASRLVHRASQSPESRAERGQGSVL